MFADGEVLTLRSGCVSGGALLCLGAPGGEFKSRLKTHCEVTEVLEECLDLVATAQMTGTRSRARSSQVIWITWSGVWGVQQCFELRFGADMRQVVVRCCCVKWDAVAAQACPVLIQTGCGYRMRWRVVWGWMHCVMG